MNQPKKWSEYKITFCNSNTIFDYLISKGWYFTDMNNRYFNYDSFQNYQSLDMETSHIGLLKHDNQLIYISEERVEFINNLLSDVSIDVFEYAFSKWKLGEHAPSFVILKRGIRILLNYFNKMRIDCGKSGYFEFDRLPQGENKICRLDLVRIVNDERIGWVPFIQEKSIQNEEVNEIKTESVYVKDLFSFDAVYDSISNFSEQINISSNDKNISREDILNATMKRNIVKEGVKGFKQNYTKIKEDIKQKEIIDGWRN
jgi:hypothetical protein